MFRLKPVLTYTSSMKRTPHTKPAASPMPSLGALVVCLLAIALPATAPMAAHSIVAAPQTPQAPLDTPTTIVNEYASEWLIYKGVVYWSNHGYPIELQANALANAPANAPKSPQAPAADTFLKRMPVGGGAIATLGVDATNNLNFSAIAVDDSGVYFSDGAGKIKVFRNVGANVVLTDVTTVSGFVQQTRLDANFLYFHSGGSGIYRVPKTGGTAQVIQNTSGTIRDFIFNDQSIYWFDGGGLWFGPKTCTTLPCTKTLLASGVQGRYMQFGNIGEAGGNPGSIIYVHTVLSPNYVESIRELTCNTSQVCQLQIYRTGATGWVIGQFAFAFLFSGPLPTFDPTMFWPETDFVAGRLLRRLKSQTTATPSEIYPGTGVMQTRIATDNRGVYFADANKIMFLPFTASAITRDLAVANIEVTQAIQNLANQVGLAADKTTYVRAYGKQFNGPPAGTVDLVLHGTRNGAPLPGSPLQPINGNVALSTAFVFDRAKAYDSWTFRLPSSWITSGNIVLRAEIDPRRRYEDTNLSNNSLSQNASFVNEPDACLFFVPVRTHNPIPRVGEPNFWATMDRFARVWPVPAIEVHSMSDPVEELDVCKWHGIPYPCWGPFELDEGSSLTNFPSDKDRVIGKLMLRQAIARGLALNPVGNICESGATVHTVGLVHPQADTTDDDGTLLGYANYYINASFYKMEPFDSQPVQGSLAWVWPRAASTLAQEVTHNFNRRHAACGTNDAVDSNWPYANKCQLNDGGATNYYGFDVKSRTPIPPEIASDFMSYRPSFSEAPKWKGQWVSDYTYSAVKGKFGLQANTANVSGIARPALPEAGEMIYAIGAIEPISNLGQLDYAFAQPLQDMTTQTRSVWQEFSAPSWRSASGIKAAEAVTYHLRLKDANGNVLDDRAVTPFQPDMHDGETPAWPFLVTFPAPAGNVAKMELLADNTIIDTITMGPAVPTVNVVAPKAGDTITDALVIEWQGSDADPQDELHYNVQYSADNGTSWIPLVEDYPGTPGVGNEVLVVRNPLALPGTNGASGRIRVLASDGYNTASAQSGAFSVAQRNPEAHITSPSDALTYEPNDDIPLQGGAIDAESGRITGTALSWAVSGFAAGSGEESSVRGLKPGVHTVVLTATDTTSKTGTAQAALHINPLAAKEGGIPALDGLCDDSAYASANQIQLAPYSDGSQATTQLLVNIGSGKLWVCLSGLARGSAAQVGRAGLWADVNFSQDTATQASDVGFFVGEDGAPIVMNASASAIDARVTANGTVWTAEMSIDLASLGGSGHAIGARLSHNAVNDAGDAYAWPYRSSENAPSSWGQTVLGNWATLQSVSPVSATVGSGAVVMTLEGDNFVSSTVTLLDGTPLNTTFISATQMSAVVPAAQLTVARTGKVQVVGAGLLSAPSPAAGLPFEVLSVAPTITSLSPDTTAQGSPISMTVTGSNFAPGAVVLFDGVALPTTFVNATQVRAQLSSAQVSVGRAVQVSVQNSGPGDGLSNELVFLVSSPRATFLPVVRK